MSSSSASPQHPISDPLSVDVTFIPGKGRCLVSKKAYSPGDILFSEEALVFASDSHYKRVLRNPLVKKALPKSFFSNFDDVIEQLEDLSRVQAPDTAQNLLQLLALYISGTPAEFSPVRRRLLEELTAANLEECVSCIKLFRKANSKIIPKTLPTELVGKLLGVLNTNQHELEDIGGSGLFVFAAIMEHDCWPNCSFSTSGTTLRVSAVRSIAVGEALSIDYSNMYYSPTAERQEYLEKVYNFKCTCALCLGPDRKRAFSCPNCFTYDAFPNYTSTNQAKTKLASTTSLSARAVKDSQSLFLPKKSDASPTKLGDWTACQLCGQVPTIEYVAKCVEAETNIAGENMPKIESLARLKDFQKAFPLLHPTHHLYFLLLDGMSLSLQDEAQSLLAHAATNASFSKVGGGGGGGKASSSSSSSAGGSKAASTAANELYSQALAVMLHQEELLESNVLPANHHEKIIFFDKVAQLAIASGDSAVAKSYFTKALDMSTKVICSKDSDAAAIKMIVELRELSRDTPKTIAELAIFYNSRGGGDSNKKGGGRGDEEEGDWEDIDD